MRHSTELFASVHACYILLGFFLFPTRVIILMYAAYWLAATDFLKSRQTAAVYLSLRGPCVSAFLLFRLEGFVLGLGGGHYATSSVNSRFWKENADTDFWLGKKRSLEGKDKKELIFTETLCQVEGSWIDGTAFIEVYKRENSRSSKFHGVCFILSVHLECVWLATISVGDCPIFFYTVRVVPLDGLPQDTPMLVLLFVWCFHFPFKKMKQENENEQLDLLCVSLRGLPWLF
jgi:hypothetical protein